MTVDNYNCLYIHSKNHLENFYDNYRLYVENFKDFFLTMKIICIITAAYEFCIKFMRFHLFDENKQW